MNNKKEKIQSTVVRDVMVTDKEHICVSRSTRDNNSPCCDIRLFKLIPIDGQYDGKLKATPKGLHFTIDRLPDIICGLIDLYEQEYGIPFEKFEAENMSAARTFYEMSHKNESEEVM